MMADHAFCRFASRFEGALPPPFDVLDSIQHAIWNSVEDSPRIVEEL
jgi:hypothetical protein